MKLRLSSDLLTGLIFVTLGLFAIVYGSRYPLGTAARMGPGYFPFVISSALTVIGLALMIRSFFIEDEPIGAIGWRPLLFVLAGTLAFGIFIDRLGLAISGVLLIVSARMADRDHRWIETVVLSVLLVALTGAVFLFGLGLPIKMIRI
jgi:hypothetical protein